MLDKMLSLLNQLNKNNMKKVIFGAMLSLVIIACGETTSIEESASVNTEEVIETEVKTEEEKETEADIELAEDLGGLLNAL